MNKTKEPQESRVALVKAEINRQLGDQETMKSLLDVTFKGLEAPLMKRALLEGMLRGFTFEDFLKKDVYAISYGDTYNLVTSIDYSRKIGAKSGIVGVDAPIYKEADGTIISCSMTVHKKFEDGTIGDFTAEVYFDEYYSGKKSGRTKPSLWDTKPRTMISKVAEMHALRKACPEELSETYVSEEFERETIKAEPIVIVNSGDAAAKLRACKTSEELERVWADLPGDAKQDSTVFEVLKEMKAIMETEKQPAKV